jgi:hypothetical protein
VLLAPLSLVWFPRTNTHTRCLIAGGGPSLMSFPRNLFLCLRQLQHVNLPSIMKGESAAYTIMAVLRYTQTIQHVKNNHVKHSQL